MVLIAAFMVAVVVRFVIPTYDDAEAPQPDRAVMHHGDSLVSEYDYEVIGEDTVPHGKCYTRHVGSQELAYVATYHYGLKEGPMYLYEGDEITSRLQFQQDLLEDTAVVYDKYPHKAVYKLFDDGALQQVIYLDEHEQPFLTFAVDDDSLPYVCGTYQEKGQVLSLEDGEYRLAKKEKRISGAYVFEPPYDLALVDGRDTVRYKLMYYSAARMILKRFDEEDGLLPREFDGVRGE